MEFSTNILKMEHNERGHDPGSCCEDDNASLEYQAQSMARTYIVTLFAKGDVIINRKTHTWQEIIDEDLDNILNLQRCLHTTHTSMSFTQSAEHFAEAAVALKAAQNAVVSDWAIRIARDNVGL